MKNSLEGQTGTAGLESKSEGCNGGTKQGNVPLVCRPRKIVNTSPGVSLLARRKYRGSNKERF